MVAVVFLGLLLLLVYRIYRVCVRLCELVQASREDVED